MTKINNIQINHNNNCILLKWKYYVLALFVLPTGV